MKMKKVLALGLVAMMSVATFAACGSDSSDASADATTDSAASETAASGDGSVYWLNFKPEADEALQGLAATYTEQTGVEVKVVTAASGEYESTLTAEMDKSEAPTLFVIGNQAGVDSWGSYAYDLTGTAVAGELSTEDFNLYDADGKLCSIPYCYESFGIITNKALLEQAGYSLDDITNFESLKAVADDIHARADELGFDAFTSSDMDSSSSWRFSGHLANMPLYYEEQEDGWTECPSEIKGTYLDLFKNVWDLYTTDTAFDKTSLATGGHDAEAEFGNGEAVFYQNGTWEYSNLTGTYSMNPEDIAMIPIYCGAEGEENSALCSGTENCWAVNANASEEDIQATLDFMYWVVTSDEGTTVFADQFGGVPYKSAKECENVFFNDANSYLADGKYTVDWAFNYTPNVDEWRAGVVAAMNNYDNGGSWDDVVTAFVSGWATQYQAAYGE